MATTQQFKDYIKANASKLDKSKFSGLTPEQNKNLFNEWKSTGSIPKTYFSNTPAPKVNTPATKQPAASNTFGQTAQTNPGVTKLESTATAFGEQQTKAAQASETALLDNAKRQQEAIAQSSQAARDRYATQQQQLDKNKQRAVESDSQRRTEASNIVKRQDEIASRQANIAAARAAQGGMQLSDSDMQDIKNDIIAKYGENIASAEQFALQTNMTLDQALTNLDSAIFKDKQAIDNFVNQLDEKELAPVLSALAEAAKGNVQAINDTKDFYNAIITKKADEEAGRMLETERLEDWQRQWIGMNQRQKGDWLFSKLGENAWVLDEYRENPAKYERMSASEALSTLQKIAVQKGELGGNAGLQVYIQLKSQAKAEGKPFNEIPAFEKLLTQGDAALRQTDATAEAKTAQRDSTNKSATPLTNTFGLTNNTRTQLDDALSKASKQQVLNALKKQLDSGKLTKQAYDKTINYVNSK